MVVVRGSIADRPWGATLASILAGGRTGQLDLVTPSAQRFQIAFVHGLVVGATSPLPVDSIARIALANRLVPVMLAKTYTKIDDVDRFADAVKLTAQQTQVLKRRVLIQRVARTFSVDTGHYVIDERITIPTIVGVEVDIRAAIYLGMRLNLSQQRLTRTLHRIGNARFQLVPGAINDLDKYELGDDEQIVIDALHRGSGATIAELEAAHRELDPRMIEALLCTLAVCDAVIQTDVAGRTPTPRAPTITPPHGSMTTSDPDISAVPMLIRQDPTVTPFPRGTSNIRPITSRPAMITKPARPIGRDKRTVPVATLEMTDLIARSRKSPAIGLPIHGEGSHGQHVRLEHGGMVPPQLRHRAFTEGFTETQPTKARPPKLDLGEVYELIEVGVMLLEQGVDHFSFLGLSFDAPVDEVREAYLEFARYLKPERLEEQGITGPNAEDANAVFAQVVIAYTVLTDPVRRRDYVAHLEATRARARR